QQRLHCRLLSLIAAVDLLLFHLYVPSHSPFFKFSTLIIRFLRIAFKYLTQNRIISDIGEVIMKYFFYALGLVSLAFFITNLNQTTFANEEENTGDGIKETVELKGVLLSEDSGFFHQVWADITSEHDKEWKISYESGYDPTLTFNDLNHDKVTELIYRSAADDGELNHSH